MYRPHSAEALFAQSEIGILPGTATLAHNPSHLLHSANARRPPMAKHAGVKTNRRTHLDLKATLSMKEQTGRYTTRKGPEAEFQPGSRRQVCVIRSGSRTRARWTRSSMKRWCARRK